MRLLFLAALGCLVLAGCTSGTTPPAALATPTTQTKIPLAHNATTNRTALVFADTLHLLVAPGLNLSTPHGNETVIATKAPLSGSQYFLWNTTIHRSATLVGARTSLLLRVTQSVAQSGGNNDPGCTATLTLIVRSNGTDLGYAGGCASAGVGILGPGDYHLQFSSPPGAIPSIHVGPGDELFLQIGLHFGSTSLGPAAFLVGGSSNADSWVRLDGLRELVTV